jgi:hypothetical protein
MPLACAKVRRRQPVWLAPRSPPSPEEPVRDRAGWPRQGWL